MSEINPNTVESAVVDEARPVSIVGSIVSVMAAKRNQTQKPVDAKTDDKSVENTKVIDKIDDIVNSEVEPETNGSDAYTSNDEIETDDAPIEVSKSAESESTGDSEEDVLDIVAFAKQSPNAKFKFMRNGKEVIFDATKAAAILGQGAAIHEEARELKVQKAEFEEESAQARNRQRDLLIAMDMTVEPRLKEVSKNIDFNFKRLEQVSALEAQIDKNDYAALMKANQAKETLINEINRDQATINELKPNVDKFRALRREQVDNILTTNRQNFKDPELKNKYNFEQLKEKLVKDWPLAKQELIPGVPNIDIVMSDEYLLSMIRDAKRLRDKVPTKAAGASVAQILKKSNGTSVTKVNTKSDEVESLRERVKAGDKKAGEELAALYFKQRFDRK